MNSSDLLDGMYGNIQETIEHGSPDNIDFHYFLPPIPFGPELAAFMRIGPSPDSIDNKDEDGNVRFTVNDMARSAVNFAVMVDYIPAIDQNLTATSDDDESNEGGAVVDLNSLISSGRSISKIYQAVLDNCMVINNSMTEEDEKRLEKYRSALYKEPKPADEESDDDDLLASVQEDDDDDFDLDNLLSDSGVDAGGFVESPDKLAEPTRVMQVYQALQTHYEQTKLKVLDQLQNISPNDPNAGTRTRLLQKKIRAAERRWEAQGRKTQVEAIKARIAQLSRSGMPQYLDDLKARFNANRLTASVFSSEEGGASLLTEDAHFTALRPNGILDSTGMKITITRSDATSKSFRNKSSSSGSVRGLIPAIPLWGRAGGSKSSDEFEREFFSNDFKIEFEIVQGIVDRPWLDLAFLESPAYTTVRPGTDEPIDQVNNIVTLSDGGDPPGGAMPLIPMTAYFVRNLTLSTSMTANTFEREREKISGRAGISFLGFGARSRHSSETITTESTREREQGKIRMDGLFLIGFASRYLDKAPNPDFESHPNVDDWI
ncbi:MAG: hypothetical protein JJU13_17895 [Balneolaceae bacterium]|nr:hypothetical protein [Balneolaceae bacterium]